MPGSVTSVFSEAENFEAALRAEGVLSVLVTGTGAFRARLTQVTLHHIGLSAAEERLPRIAFVAVPTDMILISLVRGRASAPICGGVRLAAGEIMTLGSGQRLHMRTDGACRWGSIWLPAAELVCYGTALTGAEFRLPPAARWQPPRAALRQLRQFYQAAVRTAEARSAVLADREAAHGLEQQLIEALIECLSKGPAIEATCTTRQHQDVAVRFEALLRTQAQRASRMAEIRAMLGVSAQVLRIACEEQLGMGPSEYVHRRRTQQVRRALSRPSV